MPRAINRPISRDAVLFLAGVVIVILTLIAMVTMAGKATFPIIGACIASPIVLVRGFAYLKIRQMRDGLIQVASGTVILILMLSRMVGVL